MKKAQETRATTSTARQRPAMTPRTQCGSAAGSAQLTLRTCRNSSTRKTPLADVSVAWRKRLSAHLLAALLAVVLLRAVIADAPGLVGVHFQEADFRRPDQVERGARPELDTGTAHQAFSRLWIGTICLPTAEPITFQAEADDGLILTVDGREIISGWHDPAREGTMAVARDPVLPVEIRYFQKGGAAFLRLRWSWRGQAPVVVPLTAFRHNDGDLQRARALLEGRETLSVPVPRTGIPDSSAAAPQSWSPGPWLLLDERNILAVDNLQRVVGRPRRHGEPVVDGAVDGNFQPYVSVVRDPDTHRWRMWYNVPRTPGNTMESSLALMESEDGIRWLRPHRVLVTAPIQFGASVMDEGPGFPDPARRYKAAWYKNDGMQVSASADGVTWTELAPGPLLRHSHDINAIDWDPVRRRYMAFVSFGTKLDPQWTTDRRIPHMSTSSDLMHWRQPWPVVVPDAASPREQGETQFYCMSGVVARGDLLIAMVKVLRDDLNAEPGLSAKELGDTRPHAGIGYTVLAWSPDGERWNRDTEPFLDRNPVPATWDRAHAWADEQVILGDEVFIYYGGYRFGHKAERFTTRQIGLARLVLDRYVGYAAGHEQAGALRTPARRWNGTALTVNAAVAGELRVALCEPSGKFLPGFALDDCLPISDNAVTQEVRWARASPASVRGSQVQILFQFNRGTVYAFTVLP